MSVIQSRSGLFLADDLSTYNRNEDDVCVAGLNSILPKEHGNKFYTLPIIRHLPKDVSAVAAWDSSIHDSIHLNKVTDRKFILFLAWKNLKNQPRTWMP